MLIPWQGGRCFLWDATVTDTVAPSYLPQTSSVAGASAELAANRKIVKYSQLTTSYHFVPVAFETMVMVPWLSRLLSTGGSWVRFPLQPSRRDLGQVLYLQLPVRFGVKVRYSIRAVVGSASEW